MMTGTLLSLILLFLGLGLGITALVLGLLFILSMLGGWGALAREYGSKPETYQGALLEEKLQRKAWVGLVRYGRLVVARCYERGLELTTSLPFSSPLFFPWDEIQDYQRIKLYPFPQTDQFSVGNRRIRLSNPLDELEKRKGQSLEKG
jgi:hypothetical protein